MENKENQANDDDFGLPDINPKAKETASSERKPISPRDRKPVAPPVEEKNSSAPVIATMLVVIVIALGLVYFFVIRKPSKPAVSEQPKDTTQYVVEKPIEEPIIEEPVSTAGTVTVIEERTGKSYVVVGSFFDEDLADDYAQILAKDGKSPKIIKPSGKNKFHRVAVEEFDNYNDAFNRAEAVAQDYKEKPWALKY